MKIKKAARFDGYEVADPCCAHITPFLNAHKDLFNVCNITGSLFRLTRMYREGTLSSAYFLFCPFCGHELGEFISNHDGQEVPRYSNKYGGCISNY